MRNPVMVAVAVATAAAVAVVKSTTDDPISREATLPQYELSYDDYATLPLYIESPRTYHRCFHSHKQKL